MQTKVWKCVCVCVFEEDGTFTDSLVLSELLVEQILSVQLDVPVVATDREEDQWLYFQP